MIAMALATVGIGVYISRFNTQELLTQEVQAPDVLSEATTLPSPTPDIIVSPTPVIDSSTPTAQPTVTTTPQIQTNSSEINLAIFIYPGATINSQSQTQMSLSSNASADEIINWYKNKLLSLDMPAKSIASTNTNGNYKTSMAGAKNNIKVEIEISKPADSSTASIKVNLTN